MLLQLGNLTSVWIWLPGRFAVCEALPSPGARGTARSARGAGRAASAAHLPARSPYRRQSRSARGTDNTCSRPRVPATPQHAQPQHVAAVAAVSLVTPRHVHLTSAPISSASRSTHQEQVSASEAFLEWETASCNPSSLSVIVLLRAPAASNTRLGIL